MATLHSAEIKRETLETRVQVALHTGGSGAWQGHTGVGFLDHMLHLFARHSGIDLEVTATGDREVDDHHTVEDVGITLGQALLQSIGDGAGITRYGCATIPMEEALAEVSLDLCGRSFLVYNLPELPDKIGSFDTQLAHEFWLALARAGRLTLHVNVPYGANAHHVIEAVFKATARAMKTALAPTGDGQVPSSKGILFDNK
jgi:imidazoleglycerol-phosphate dehydratase